MNADVERAVESLDQSLEGLHPAEAHWSAIKQALRDQEAVNAAQATELRTLRGEYAKEFNRAEKAEYLLREAHPFVPITYSSTGQPQLHARITAHLGGEQ